MKFIKRAFILMMVLVLCATPLSSYAAGKNVTSSMKNDKNLKKIVKMISNYTDCELANKASKKTTTEKLKKSYNALSIAAYVGCQSQNNYSFTKKKLQNICYNLFGSRPGTSSISKAKYVRKEGSRFVYSGGDWGEYVPKYSIKKIVKVKKGVYDVTITNKLAAYVPQKTVTIGTTTIRLKKNSKSSYGYKITSLKYKGNGKGYF